MPSEKLMFAALGDVAGQVRGKGFPVADRASRFISGVGWTPTNVQITCFDSIADSPYGALGDLILRLAPETEVEVAVGGDVSNVHLVLGDVEYVDGRAWECCLRSMARAALSTQTPMVSASSRQGSRTVSSSAEPPGSAVGGSVSTSTMGARRAVVTSGLGDAGHGGAAFGAGWGSQQV